jgi:hypothetical protein
MGPGLSREALRLDAGDLIRCGNELFHHYYRLDDIRIAVPEGIKVIKQNRKLTGDGGPDLTAPSAP